MGMFDSILGGGGGDSNSDPVPLEPQWQIDMRKRLAEAAEPQALSRISESGKSYGGELTAGLSSQEKTGLSSLDEYLNSPSQASGAVMQGAQSELEKTLSGEEYDPVGGTYYQAYRSAVMRELQEAKDRLAAETSASDKYFGGGRIKETGNLEEGATNTLSLELGRLFEQERMNRLNAVPMAQNFTNTLESQEQGRIGAAMGYGALPREVEQQGLTNEYNEWVRALTDSGIPLSVAQGLSTYQPPYYQEQEEAGVDWGGIAKMVALAIPTGGTGAAAAAGAGAVAAA